MDGGFTHSGTGLSGSFDWQLAEFTFTAVSDTATIGCRLGHFGNTVTGKAWFDDISLTELD
jgi:hypothetical protein